MKLTQVLEKAKAQGINDLILKYGVSSSLDVNFVGGELQNTTFSNDFSFVARGGIDGKLVSFSSDTLDNKTVELMVKTMKDQKNYTQPYDTDLIIDKPDFPYAKNKTYYSQLTKLQVPDLVKIGEELSKAVASKDPRIKNTEIEVGVSSSSSEFLNSKCLNLKSKSSYLIVSCQVVAEEGKETVSDYVLKTYTNVKKANVNKIADEVSKKTLAKLHGKAGVGGTKTCLLKPAAFDSIVSIITGHFSMFDVDRKMSLLVDKLDKKVFSDLLTIEEKPNTNDIFSESYDGEGYPTSNKVLVEKGVIKTYLYDQEMAKKYNHVPTGNGYGSPVVHPGVSKIEISSGETKEKDLIKSIADGYVITSLTGGNAGIDYQTGGFTLSAEGFYVKNGRIKYAVNQFTIGGDVISFLQNVIGLSDKQEDLFGGDKIPSALVKDVVVSC